MAAVVVMIFPDNDSPKVRAADNGIVRKELTWSLDEHEIATPKFSPDGQFIVFSKRVHWPDGHEAEELFWDQAADLRKRKKDNPRFQDPVVTLIDLKGNVTCEVKYGSDPIVLPDNKTIILSRQKSALTGLRSLAETLSGNDIALYDCGSKASSILAAPKRGFLDEPVLLPGNLSIAFAVNEAVNGAFAGKVAIEGVDLTGENRKVFLAKKTVAAFPCSKAPKKHFCHKSNSRRSSPEFSTIVYSYVLSGGRLLALQGIPVPAAGDTFMADDYEIKLLSLAPEKKEILRLGQKNKMLSRLMLQPADDGKVMIGAGRWRPFSLKTKSWLPDIASLPADVTPVIFSPDQKYYLSSGGHSFSLVNAATGENVFTEAVNDDFDKIYDMVWSADSRRFAVVINKTGIFTDYHDTLNVYAIGPNSPE